MPSLQGWEPRRLSKAHRRDPEGAPSPMPLQVPARRGPVTIDYTIGDCLEVLRDYPENHFDSCVTDPPYRLCPHKLRATYLPTISTKAPAAATGGS